MGMPNMRLPSRKHHNTKIVGRNASVHGHTARTQTTRWNIPLNEQPLRKTKTSHHCRRTRPNATLRMLHFEWAMGRLTYRITNAQNYTWICTAAECVFATHGEVYHTNKNQYSTTSRKNKEQHTSARLTAHTAQ